ncbi:MAG: hypothetical protein JHD16_01095 [Solirubrobacteraceae bacterium]|nr:hypothetical protein [Solirubrobacteraceae bacterium]
MSVPSLTLVPVTESFRSSRSPTAPLGSLVTAYEVPPSAMKTAMVDMTLA